MPELVATDLAATPPMGWNSWNMFGSAIDERALRETADALVRSGLADCGYRYLVIDDCWSEKDGRDADGMLVPDAARFPSGIAALADYAHALGLKLGIYSDAADRTCAGYPGSYGYEQQDAAQWAAWGVDFLKYDYCHAPGDQQSAIERYGRMGAALQATGRPILFSICEWGGRAPQLWGRAAGGHMWRVSGDVFDTWHNAYDPKHNFTGTGVSTLFDVAAELQPYAGPGGWNDLDMLVVGLGGQGYIGGGGMSLAEYRTHMALWCMACSPLMIGCDVRSLDPEIAAVLMNREVIAVNQDSLGVAARRIKRSGDVDLWSKPLADGALAIAVVNRGDQGADVPLRARDVGLLDAAKRVRDLWAGADAGELGAETTLRVEPHGTLLLRITS